MKKSKDTLGNYQGYYQTEQRMELQVLFFNLRNTCGNKNPRKTISSHGAHPKN